jgi:DNA-binding MarR family transcriptional regulator
MPKSHLQVELGKKNPFDSAEQEATLNLARTLDYVMHPFSELFAANGISGPQYNILRILRGVGGDGLPCQELGSRMVTRMPDVTRLVDRLESAGLVERRRTPQDRRIVLVRLTRPGRELLARLDRPELDLHKQMLGHLSRGELDELNRLLVKARQAGGP